MIKLEHLTKYYNKKKLNQIVVCDDINLEFEDTGLVGILGASGSGKTTLLNVISGMDKTDKGKIVFNDVIFDKYNHKKWDKIRKANIGYVYQNYNLIKGISVYENIEPVLKMMGIHDETIIREQVIYLLEAVGLANYADRLVKRLSGGQQQRVAFARALANNPKVILADEPTGNLDGKTTIEIMNVIKEISKTRLVILVTHEKKLCKFYSDRIIEIKNGAIVKDYPNNQKMTLDYAQEHIITLSEFEKTSINSDQLNISRYTDKAKKESLDVDLIERNQTLYVKVHSNSLTRTKYIDDESEILIQDVKKEKVLDEKKFILDDKFPKEEHNTANAFLWKDTINYALRKLNIFKKGGGKVLFLAMLFLGIIISISVGLLGEIYHVEEPYSSLDPNYITVHMDRSQFGEYQLLNSVDNVDQLMLINKPLTFNISTPSYYEVKESLDISAQPIDIKYFDEESLVYGQLPGEYEIVIDQSVADDIIKNGSKVGIESFNDVLNCKFKLITSGDDMSIGRETSINFNISGIANSNSKSVWMKEELIYSLATRVLVDYRILGDSFSMISGDIPDGENYVMINDQYSSVKDGEIPYNIGTATGTFYISGVYHYEDEDTLFNFEKIMLSKIEFIKHRYFRYNFYINQDFDLLVYATDVEAAIVSLEEAGYEVSADVYEPTIAQTIKLEENQTFYLLAIGGILMSAFCIYLVMRSSLISRMYEISVYRSIGISRKEIRRIFLTEILLTTTFSSALGFILMLLLLTQAESALKLVSVTRFTGLSILFVFIGMYGINIIFGLMPINTLLRKTPANIMKQSDL